MKTAKEYIDEVDNLLKHEIVSTRFGDRWKDYAKMQLSYEDLLNIAHEQGRRAVLFEQIIERVQKEAYNQALDDVLKNAKLSLFDWHIGGFVESILSSNHYSIDDGNYVEIDKESILKLKKI